MNNKAKMVGCTIAGFILGSLTIAGANQAIRAMQNTQIKVKLNYQVQEFKDETTGETQYPITYNNRTYLPLRNVANLAGLDVYYDNDTNTALLSQDVIKEIISKAEEQLGKTNVIDEEQGRKVVKAYIRGIDLADDVYIKTLYESKINKRGDFTRDTDGYLEYGDISYEGAYNYMMDNPIASMPVYGKITFMIEYDKDFKGSWAGNGPAYYTGRYAIGERLFTYENGELTFATGGGKGYEEYENIVKEITISKDLKIKQIKEIDASYNEVGKKYILTDAGEVYIATFNNLDTDPNRNVYYIKVEKFPDKVVDIRYEHNGGLVICTLKNGNKVFFTYNGEVFDGIYKYYSFLDGGYSFINSDNGMILNFANDTKLSIYMKFGESSFRVDGTYTNNDNRLTCKLTKCFLEEDKREIDIDGELIIDYAPDNWRFNTISWEYNPLSDTPSYYDAFFYADFIQSGDVFCGATT